jgi:hypothetical protein
LKKNSLLLLAALVAYSAGINANLIQVGERVQYTVYIETNLTYGDYPELALTFNYRFKNPQLYLGKNFDSIVVEYDVNCKSLEYKAKIIGMADLKTGLQISELSMMPDDFVVPDSLLKKYIAYGCKLVG